LFGTSWRVARIAGIEVRVDSSWVVIALLITYSMYLRFSVLYKAGSSPHPISTGGCTVGERSTAERSTADRTADT